MASLLVRHPSLVPHAIGAAWAFRGRHWYRRPPFLPVPPASYLRWRMETAYGDENAAPTDAELENFLRWGTRMRTLMRHGG